MIDKADYPKKPELTSWGAYHPVQLQSYLKKAHAVGMSSTDIAGHLKVPLHRVVYFQNRDLMEINDRKAAFLSGALMNA